MRWGGLLSATATAATKHIQTPNYTDAARLAVTAGLPDDVAKTLSLFDVEAAEGGLFHDGRQLSTLIGRPTPPLHDVLRAWLPPATASA